MPTAEQLARIEIDRLLTAGGCSVQDFKKADIRAARGVAIREFSLIDGCGFADTGRALSALIDSAKGQSGFHSHSPNATSSGPNT